MQYSQTGQVHKLQRQWLEWLDKQLVTLEKLSCSLQQAHQVPKSITHSCVSTIKTPNSTYQPCMWGTGSIEYQWYKYNNQTRSGKGMQQRCPCSFYCFNRLWPFQRTWRILWSTGWKGKLPAAVDGWWPKWSGISDDEGCGWIRAVALP